MIFLHFLAEDDGSSYEWGFYVSTEYVPMIGDTVNIVFAEPKSENWNVDSEYPIEAVVVKREFSFFNDCMDNPEIYLTIKLKEEVPPGLVEHSTEWPAFEKVVPDA